MPVFHYIIDDDKDIEIVSTFLANSMKYYCSNKFGLLFQKDGNGLTACELAFKENGKDEILEIIGKHFPFNALKVPILHHVAMHAPHLINEFIAKFPSAAYMRDDVGRNLNQARLASGHLTFTSDGLFFVCMSDDSVREIDPGTDLYPFMVAASGETSDLSTVHNLLLRNPSLVSSGCSTR